MRLPAGKVLRAHRPERLERSIVDLQRRHPEVLEAELELVLDAGHDDLVLRVLEDARNRAGQVARPCRPRVPPGDLDPAGKPPAVEVRNQSGESAQQRRLSRARRPEQADELAGMHLQRDLVERGQLDAGVVVRQLLDPG